MSRTINEMASSAMAANTPEPTGDPELAVVIIVGGLWSSETTLQRAVTDQMAKLVADEVGGRRLGDVELRSPAPTDPLFSEGYTAARQVYTTRKPGWCRTCKSQTLFWIQVKFSMHMT